MKIQLVTALLATCLCSTGYAVERLHLIHSQPYIVAQQQSQKPISKEQAVRIAKRQVDGKVLSANLRSNGHNQHYRVKILTDNGRVKTVTVNAKR